MLGIMYSIIKRRDPGLGSVCAPDGCVYHMSCFLVHVSDIVWSLFTTEWAKLRGLRGCYLPELFITFKQLKLRLVTSSPTDPSLCRRA